MSWLNYLNPLNWPSDLSNAFIQQLENGLLYLLASFLDAILNLSGELGNALIGVLETIISGIIATSRIAIFFIIPPPLDHSPNDWYVPCDLEG